MKLEFSTVLLGFGRLLGCNPPRAADNTGDRRSVASSAGNPTPDAGLVYSLALHTPVPASASLASVQPRAPPSVATARSRRTHPSPRASSAGVRVRRRGGAGR